MTEVLFCVCVCVCVFFCLGGGGLIWCEKIMTSFAHFAITCHILTLENEHKKLCLNIHGHMGSAKSIYLVSSKTPEIVINYNSCCLFWSQKHKVYMIWGCNKLVSVDEAGAYAGGGGGFGGVQPPPPPLAMSIFFFACHPGGRSGRRTIPLPNNVNDAKNCQEKKMCRSPPPPPPPPPLSDFFRPGAVSRNLLSKTPPFKKSCVRAWDEVSPPVINWY